MDVHFIYGYMVKNNSDSEKENPLLVLMGYSFSILTARNLLYAPVADRDDI